MVSSRYAYKFCRKWRKVKYPIPSLMSSMTFRNNPLKRNLKFCACSNRTISDHKIFALAYRSPERIPFLIGMRRIVRHGLPVGDTPCKLRIALIADECPALLLAEGIMLCAASIGILNKRSGVLEIAVDGLYGSCYAIFLKRMSISRQYIQQCSRVSTYLPDLLAKYFSLVDHPLAMRRFPQCP